MLKSGMILFVVPTLTLGLDIMGFDIIDFEAISGPWIKLLCSASLVASVACFLMTYYAAELARGRSAFKHR